MKHCVCEYCGERFEQGLERCPHCGGRNRSAAPASGNAETQSARPPVPESVVLPAAAQEPKKQRKKPRTIEELQEFARERQLPLEQMRFHLGEDYRAPKAYGIFREDDGSVTVYKNKADGSRAIRYHGTDEAYAVNELLLKMREEIGKQRSFQNALKGQTRSGSAPASSEPEWLQVVKKNAWKYLLILAVCIGVWALLRHAGRAITRGYYLYKNNYYYRQDNSWYLYQNDSWLPVVPAQELSDNADVYYADEDYNDSFGVDDFIGSPYYFDDDDAHQNGQNDDDAWEGDKWKNENDNDNNNWAWNDDDDDDDWGWDDDDDDWGGGWDNDDDWDWGGGWDDIGDWDDDW